MYKINKTINNCEFLKEIKWFTLVGFRDRVHIFSEQRATGYEARANSNLNRTA
jgi:hypothetical protein